MTTRRLALLAAAPMEELGVKSFGFGVGLVDVNGMLYWLPRIIAGR
jgi:hypothetical protein